MRTHQKKLSTDIAFLKIALYVCATILFAFMQNAAKYMLLHYAKATVGSGCSLLAVHKNKVLATIQFFAAMLVFIGLKKNGLMEIKFLGKEKVVFRARQILLAARCKPPPAR